MTDAGTTFMGAVALSHRAISTPQIFATSLKTGGKTVAEHCWQ
jgi:hypothetical protein